MKGRGGGGVMSVEQGKVHLKHNSPFIKTRNFRILLQYLLLLLLLLQMVVVIIMMVVVAVVYI